MDGLIILLLLVPVVFLILLLSILSRSGEQRRLLESLYDKVKDLTNEVAHLHKELKEKKPSPATESVKPLWKEDQKEAEIPSLPLEPVPVIKKEPVAAQPAPVIAGDEKVVTTEKESIVQKIPPAYTMPQPKQARQNKDIEKFIGENVANKIGIAVLVLGISFFVKYAIDKNWINEAGRVIIGLVSGGILIGLAHYFRNSYRSFSSVLVGGGLTVFYFSIAFAFHQYHLIGQTAAFIIMLFITAFAVALSLFYQRQELAVLATIGGFITPFLVSTGQDNYVALFTYLCILNAGLMVLAWFKRWPAINTIALFFTTIIFGGWLISESFSRGADLPYKNALLFATLFYLLFVAMNIINTLRLKEKFTGFDFIILLSTNFLFYGAGMVTLDYWNGGIYQGLFTGLLGVFNIALAALFYKMRSADRNFVFLLIGLAITFISLVAPVEFDGNHIVLFWAAESVVLLWLYQRSSIRLLKFASGLVLLLMLFSLLVNWSDIYLSGTTLLPVLLNKGFITTVVATVALFSYHGLMKKETTALFYGQFSAAIIRRMVLIAAVLVAYLAGVLEIYYQFATRYTEAPVFQVYLQLYSFLFTALLLFLFRKDVYQPLMRLLLTGFCFAFYLFSLPALYEVSLSLFETNKGILFLAHWAGAAVLLWLLYGVIVSIFNDTGNKWDEYKPAFTWVVAASILILLSAEMYHIVLWTNYRDATDWSWYENLYYKAMLSILWGVCSFAMMWLGMKKNFRPLRIISLSLFTATLLKLFFYDIINIPPGGKIAAFILLGVLLLVISFMYQRLKKIIIDNKGE
jgi:uncharacterized membrane protein